MRFRKKPVVIEAVQLRWDTWEEMCAHANVGKLIQGKPEGCFVDEHGSVTTNTSGEEALRECVAALQAHRWRIGLRIPTLEGVMLGVEGDWIIRGVQGELYPCKPDIFAATYEPAE